MLSLWYRCRQYRVMEGLSHAGLVLLSPELHRGFREKLKAVPERVTALDFTSSTDCGRWR